MSGQQDRVVSPKEASSTRQCPWEQKLRTTTSEDERWEAFCELVKHHGERLVVEARRLAGIMGLASQMGDEAISEAFIRISQGLGTPWEREQSFLDRYRREVWSVLRHNRTRLARTLDRFPQITEELDPEAPDSDPERQCQSNELYRNFFKLSRTRKQRLLAKAWSLSKQGYDWIEVKERIEWPGTCDSLRVSVSRFFGQMKTRIQKQVG